MSDRVQILPKVLERKNVLPTNNVLACFTVKHLPFGQAFIESVEAV